MEFKYVQEDDVVVKETKIKVFNYSDYHMKLMPQMNAYAQAVEYRDDESNLYCDKTDILRR